MVAPIRFLSGRQQQQKIGIEGSTEEQKVLEVVGRVGIGTTIFDADYNLDVRGSANISGILSVGQIISGAGNSFTDLYVTGLSTFTSDVDINASVDISNNLSVTGLSTFSSLIDANSGIDASSLKVEDLTDNRVVIVGVDGELEDDINLTFNGSQLFVGVDLDVDGQTDLDNLNVTGPATFTSNVIISTGELHGPAEFIIDPAAVGDNTGLVRIKGDLYVDGTEFIVNSTTIELADYRVGIATSIGTNLLLDGAGIGIGSDNVEKTFTYNNSANTLESSIGLGVTTGGDFKTGTDSVLNRTTLGPTVVNSSLTNLGTLTSLDVNGQTDLDNLRVSGIATFESNVYLGDNDKLYFGDNNDLVIYSNGTSGVISHRSGGTTYILGDNIQIADPSATNTYAIFDESVKLNYNNITKFETTGYGATIIGGLSVSGLSTFASDVDVNASVDISSNLTVDGLSDLDELNVAGFSTFASDVDINSSVDISSNLTVDGLSDLDELNVAGLSTFTSDLDVNASVDISSNLIVNGLSDLEELNVAGLSTFASDLDVNASVDISTNLTVDGLSDLDELNVAGLSTFASNVDVNASVDISTNLTVDGLSDLDELNVAGLSTFASDVDINASVDISSNLTVDGLSDLDELNVAGITTFTDTTDNTLGNVNTGALQIDGGLGVAKNVSIGGSLYVQGQSEFIGIVTFRGGTINIGDQDTDDINVGGEFVSSLVPNDDDSYDLGSPTKEWRDLYVDGLAEIDDLNVSGLSTFASDVDINSSVDISSNLTVDGLSDLDELNVAGLSTFASDVDINSSVDISSNLTVDGLSDLDELNVAGLSTFASDIDINASVDISTNLTVDGLSDLDELNVAGLSTFQDDVNIGVGGTTAFFDVSTGNIGIGTDNPQAKLHVVDEFLLSTAGAASTQRITERAYTTDNGTLSWEGTAGQLFSITNNLTSGSIFSVNDVSGIPSIDVDADGTIQLAPYGSSEFVGVGLTNPTAKLDVNGNIRLRSALYDNANQIGNNNEVLISTGAGVSWSTLTSGGIAGGQEILSVSGSDTYYITASNVTSGIATAAFIDNQVIIKGNGFVGIGSTQPTATLDVNGDVNVSGTATITSLDVDRLSPDGIDFGAALYVPVADGSGSWDWQSVTVAGAGVLDAIAVLDEGSLIGTSGTVTALDFRGNNIIATGQAGSNIGTITVSDTPTFDTLNVTGVSTFASDVDVNASVDISSNLTVDGLSDLDELNVAGIATFTSDLDVNASVDISTNLTVDGLSDLDELNVAGIATFASDVDINASVDISTNLTVDGLSDLDELNVVGLSTFTSDLDVNASIDISSNLTVDGLSDLDELNVAGLSTFASNVDVNASVDISTNLVVDGLSDLDELNVAGVSTFASDVDVNASVDISTNLTVDGLSDLDELNVAGVSTFASDVDVNASVDISTNLTVDGHTELDTLNVSIATTTASLTLANAGVAVTAILDEDLFTSNRADALATQQSIKAYVDAQITSQDLNFSGDTGTGSIDLDSETFTIAGTTNEIETVGAGNTLTIGLPDEVAITTSLTVGSATTINSSGINAPTGIITASSFVGDITGDLTGVASTATKLETARDFSVSGDVATASGVSFDGTGNVDLAVTLSNTFSANTSGIITSTGGFVGDITGDLTGVASTATKLETARDFSITGSFVTASAVSFDGTANVALGATITPDSIILGTYTSGDYVESITGTANEIEVTGGTGEGSTPQIGLPNDVTIAQDLTVNRDVQIVRNLNVDGNITIGGTTATLFTQTLTVADSDLILGVRTDGLGNDIANDTTANHGGIAIASTEGNPLITLVNPGAGETLPSTYKKIMWFKSGSFAGLGTDAWLINYGVGIGSTQVPNGVRLAAGNVQFTENDLSVVRNINASGIITGTLDNTLTLATSGTGLSGSATYDNSGAATFTVTSNATSANTAGTIVARDGSGNFSAGTITANLTGNVTGDLTGVASTATKLETARDFSVSGDVATASPVSFNGTGNVDLAVTLSNNFNADTSGIITASRFVSDVTAGTAPFTVSSTTLVSNLNADLLDGQEGSYYLDYNNFVGVATDADKLDGLDSTQFLRSDAADTGTGLITLTNGLNVTGGNVGIGTDNPGATLHVRGSTSPRIENTGTISLIRFQNSNAENVFYGSDADNAVIYTQSTEKLRVTSSGRFGIGTSNPNATVDIQSSSAELRLTSIGQNRSVFLNSATGLEIQQIGAQNITFATNAVERVRINSLGNIGIGTDNPTQKLDVNGGARFRGAIYDNNNVVGAANSILTSTGSGAVWSDIAAIPVGDASTLDGQDGSYYLDYNNFVGIATDADKLDGEQGSYYLDYTNFVGIATDADKLDGEQGSYYLDYNNFVGIATDADKLDGEQGSYYLDYNNFVGIATDADKLDGEQGSYYRNASNINAGTIGDAYLPATISSDITGNAATATTATNVVGTANRILYNNATDTTTTSNNLVFDGNNVGIGTTNPQANLDIWGGSANTTYFRGGTGNVARQLQIRSEGTITPGAAHIFNAPSVSGTIIFETNNDEALRIDSSQRIGIGSISPSQKLDVNGSIRIRERIYDSNNSAGAANYVLTSGGSGGVWSWQAVSAIGSASINISEEGSPIGTFTDINFTSSNLTATGTGSTATITLTDTPTFTDLKVTGISTIPTISGLTTFQDNVEFKGNIDLGDQDRLRLGNSQDLQIYHTSVDSFIQDTGTGNLYIDSSTLIFRNELASENVRITSSGDVGIGTTNPTAKLDVNGGLIVSGVSTATTFVGNLNNTLTLNTSGTGLSGSTTYNNSGAATFTVTSNATSANTASTIVARDASGNFSAGTITLAGELRGPASFVIDPATVGDNTGTVVIKGNLQIDGTTTTVNSTTITVDDKNIELGSVATPSDTTADSGGITLKGSTDKTFNWINATDSWTSSENIDIASGKTYKINTTDVLSATTLGSGVVNSSLTSLGTLNELNVSGVSTFSAGVSITGNIDVDNTTSIGSSTSSLSTLTQTAIHTELDIATYRSVEYTIQATQGTNFHATKILALHNGTTAYHSEYGTIFNNSSVASFDVDISGGNLRLLATGASASQTDYVVNFVATKV